MRIDIIDTIAGFEAVRENWDQVFLEDPDAQHFLSWIWLKNYLSRRRRWFILALRERDPEAPYVAFFPLRLITHLNEKTGLFYDEIIMAGNFAADYTGFIVRPDYEHHAIAGFASFLKHQNWTDLKLEYFSGPAGRREKMIEALQGPEVMFRDSSPKNSENIDNTICPIVPLPASFDDYLEERMSSQTRQKLRRFLRKVEGDDIYRITMATAETIDRDLDILFNLWRIKWSARKGAERTERLIITTREMLMDSFNCGNLEVPVFWHGDQPLGALANIVDRQKKAILFYITGRDENWKTPSPGLILHGYCIRRAIEHGFKTYDFLRGNEPYKYMFGAEERRISCTLFRTRNGQNLHGVLNPRSIRFVYEQALDMYRNGARSKAEIAFNQVLQSAPGHTGAEFGLANLLFDRGKLTEALTAYKVLVEQAPDPTPIQMRLGDTQLALHQYEQAAETFRRVGEIGPHLIQAHYKRGIALAASKRLAEAEAVFAAIQDVHSDDPTSLDYAAKAGVALERLRSIAEPAVGKTDVVPETIARWNRGRQLSERRRPRLH
ncbi:GNAT family N-acetyltransferase [Rhizobium leguminosarum]|uniref:GNAT family N-acetyltransferase n=1 Tax=Rhizobium leguminosarum TaxID=384 RepID=UPI001C93CBBF|nr:GNAT family N-acetyltransferase [Rhizobium leguminosarum]MBY5819327.1 GNAT family N-acetyltransferase [Rhizobium leguminosarum]